jgi:hypothetical protein
MLHTTAHSETRLANFVYCKINFCTNSDLRAAGLILFPALPPEI